MLWTAPPPARECRESRAVKAPTRSRPQHQKRTHAMQQSLGASRGLPTEVDWLPMPWRLSPAPGNLRIPKGCPSWGYILLKLV